MHAQANTHTHISQLELQAACKPSFFPEFHELIIKKNAFLNETVNMQSYFPSFLPFLFFTPLTGYKFTALQPLLLLNHVRNPIPARGGRNKKKKQENLSDTRQSSLKGLYSFFTTIP